MVIICFLLSTFLFSAPVRGSMVRNYTVDLQYQATLSHPLEYFGYVGTGWEDEETLKEMLSDNANLVVTDFGWLSSFLMPDENDHRKAKINTEHYRFAGFAEFLHRCSQLGFKNLVGIITCTNFHEYPEWFRKLYPDIYALDVHGNPEPLLYEIELPQEKKQFWTNVEHPVLNDLRCEFVKEVIEKFKGHEDILVWGVDGETLYPPVLAERGFDQSKWALQHFRAYLKLKYRDIHKLNEAWGTRYGDFKEVLPPREIALNKANLDWHTFRVRAIGEYLRYLYTAYKHSDPWRFSLTWLHDMGLRDDELKRAGCAPFEYVLIGDGLIANPIVRPPKETYNTKYFEIMTSFGKPVFSSQLAYFPRPWPGYMIRRQIYECLGLGVWSVGLVTWTWPEHYLINWGIRGTEGQKEVRRVFGELKELAPYLKFMWPLLPITRIYISQPVWIMDGWKDSWDTLHLDFLQRQIPKRYIVDWQIQQGELERLGVKILISLDNEIIGKKTLDKLEDFVRQGGNLVIIGEFNLYDEELQKGREAGFLKRLGKAQKFGGVTYRRATYGKGEVIRIEGSYSIEVGEFLEYIFANEKSFKPVRIIKTEPSSVEIPLIYDTTREQQDLAEDFSGHSSLGQLIIAPSEFIYSLSISTPTYWKKVERYGLKMEVFLKGPEGEKIGERYVPAEEIKDNGWIEIVINKRVPKGSPIYLRISPSEPLPPATIGWWSLGIGEKQKGGAYVDDVEVEGVVRRVIVKYRAPENPSKVVESFLLSDGVNMGVVLVNTSDQSFAVSLKIGEELVPLKENIYLAKEPLKNGIMGEGKAKDIEAFVSLAPYGTAVIIFEAKVEEEDVRALMRETRKDLERVKRMGGDVGLGRAFWERAEDDFGKGNYSKALASLLKARNLLFIAKPERISVEGKGRKEIEIKILNSKGLPACGASLLPVVSPLYETLLSWREVSQGVYRLIVDRKDLPSVYDYHKGEYVPYMGDFVLRVRARKDDSEGYSEIVIPQE